jgi:glycosyltransferase involved in cell wall biosynthesis
VNAWIAVAGSRARAVATIMSMSVAPFLPRTMPLVVGTQEIGAIERQQGRWDVTVVEPPVHLVHNDRMLLPEAPALRRALGLAPGSTVVTAVSRLAHELKMEGLLTAIEVVPRLGANVQLLVVGDGPARAEVHRAARLTNDALGREAVVLTGELADPRPAYAVADIALGMGGSVLRAMSFGKPVVVQGELGFWKVLDENTIDGFLWHGWYGLGADSGDGAYALTAELQPLLADPLRRRRLGQFGRALVEDRFSLEHAVDLQIHQYEAVMAAGALPPAVAVTDGVRSVVHYVRHAGERKWGRLRGQAGRDDFNRTGPQPRNAAAARRGTSRSTPVFKES